MVCPMEETCITELFSKTWIYDGIPVSKAAMEWAEQHQPIAVPVMHIPQIT